MRLLRETRDYLARCETEFWPERRQAMLGLSPERAKRLDGLFENCEERERLYLCYVLASLPLSDLSLCDPSLFSHTVEEAVGAREEFPWYGPEGLPEHLFLTDLLCPRVFDEELSDCRALFRGELGPRVKGLPIEEAILEVNRWCAEHVTYRSTDDYTDSALRVYNRGYGRCGEESTFTVTALRSVGIAARQVYAPWWSHCDDNHAWVEAWDGERWRYLGACEPEPELDRGWFTGAASRAMLVHSHTFAAGSREDWERPLFPQEDARGIGTRDSLVSLRQTPRYSLGRERLVTVFVRDAEGTPVPGARVEFQVLNMADFHTIAVRKTGLDGKAALPLGEGSILLCAWQDGRSAEKLLEVREDTEVTLELSEKGDCDLTMEEFDFRAPKGMEQPPAPLAPARKKSRRETLDRCAALRERWTALAGEREPLPERNGGALPLAGRETLSCGGDCVLRLTAPGDRPAVWGQGFSLSLWEEGEFKQVRLHSLSAGETGEFSLPQGKYRLITTERLPKGDQLAWRWDFSLKSGKTLEIGLKFRKAAAADLLERISLTSFTLTDEAGQDRDSAALLAERPCSLLLWLEPGREPTEHILNELWEAAGPIEASGCGVHFLLEDMDSRGDPALERARKALPGAGLWRGDFLDGAPALSRQMYVDPDKLPLVLLADRAGNGRYACAGYNVGTASLVLRLMEELGREPDHDAWS